MKRTNSSGTDLVIYASGDDWNKLRWMKPDLRELDLLSKVRGLNAEETVGNQVIILWEPNTGDTYKRLADNRLQTKFNVEFIHEEAKA